MKLISHGPQSSLRDHTLEVVSQATSQPPVFWEVVGGFSHDILKATPPWQGYGYSFKSSKKLTSPHHHAISGALYAYTYLIHCGVSAQEALLAAHPLAAHHSKLSSIDFKALASEYNILLALHQNKEPNTEFYAFLNWILEELSSYPEAKPITPEQWTQLVLNLMDDIKCATFNACLFELKPFEVLNLQIKSQQFLSRLVLADHSSAAKQSSDSPDSTLLAQLPGHSTNTTRRIIKEYPKSHLSNIRSQLKAESLKLGKLPDPILLIEAGTGTGKTEAILSLAETILQERGLKKIVFTAPLNTILNQTKSDYFSGTSTDVLMWNCREKLRTNAIESTWTQVLPEDTPFSAFYNITTFNQVFGALFSTNRLQATKGVNLTDAVIILDEFHKLPTHLANTLIWTMRPLAAARNLVFILSSATPLKLQDLTIPTLDPTFIQYLRREPRLQARRTYTYVGKQDIKGIQREVNGLESKYNSVLVVLNQIDAGTQALYKALGAKTSILTATQGFELNGRTYFVLDGTIPPFLRAELIKIVKAYIKSNKPITLIATQMIEAGVDVDFESGYVDYQELAALIQRGGRINRNGLRVTAEIRFGLLQYQTKNGTTTTSENLARLYTAQFELNHPRLALMLKTFYATQLNWVCSLPMHKVLTELNLQEQLTKIQADALTSATYLPEQPIVLARPTKLENMKRGLQLEHFEFLSDLYPGEHFTLPFYYFSTLEEWSNLKIRLDKKQTPSLETRRLAFQDLSQHLVEVGNDRLFGELTSELEKVDLEIFTRSDETFPGIPVYVQHVEQII